MLSCHRLQILAVSLALTLSSITLWAFKDFVPPHPENANSYPSKDVHSTDQVTAALDLYNTPPKDQIFGTKYGEYGILPVLLIITNDGNQPINVSNLHAELVTSGKSKLEALETDDVVRRVSHINGSSTNPSPRVGPIPLSGNKNKKAQKQLDEITAARFAAQAVEPHTTKSGFLFFDIEGVQQPAAGSHVYLTGVRDADGNELIYFDIPVIASNAAGAGSQ